MYTNLRKILNHPTSLMSGILGAMILAAVYIYFTQQGNLYWTWATYDPWWLSTWKFAQQIVTVIGFGLFVAAQVYRGTVYRSGSGSDTILGTISSILIAIVAGCPTCGFTLAGAIGIAGVFTASWLPWGGEEIKLIGTLILLGVVWHSLVKLDSCKVPTKKS